MQMFVLYPTSKICFASSFFELSGKHIIWVGFIFFFFLCENYMEFIVSTPAEHILQKLPCGPQRSGSEDRQSCRCASWYGSTFPEKLEIFNLILNIKGNLKCQTYAQLPIHYGVAPTPAFSTLHCIFNSYFWNKRIYLNSFQPKSNSHLLII